MNEGFQSPLCSSLSRYEYIIQTEQVIYVLELSSCHRVRNMFSLSLADSLSLSLALLSVCIIYSFISLANFLSLKEAFSYFFVNENIQILHISFKAANSA